MAHIRILEPLDTAGGGEVYLGYDEVLRRQVALKAIRGKSRLSPEIHARSLREARILSQLDHPNICRIFDRLEGEEYDLLVLELVEGARLEAAGAELDARARMKVAIQIAEALEAAHSAGVVHRTLEPENVIVTAGGEAKVLDFGRGDGAAASNYTSPEQDRGEAATTASDMYSFGLLLQRLFTGKSPFPADAHAVAPISPADGAWSLPVEGLASDLTALIDRLKSAAPAARPTASAAGTRLRWILDKPKRRMRRVAAVAIVSLFAVGGLKYTLDLRRASAVAEERRSQAEDLIAFMLGDLRAKLAPLGRLDILDDVGARAESYFASVPSGELSAEELLHRSAMLNQIGGVRIDQGRLADAAPAFEESLRLAQDLVAREPNESRFLARLGEAFFWLGYQRWEQGDLDGSYRYYSDYLRSSERLVALEPESATWQTELAYGHTNLGTVERRRGNLESAEQSFRRSIEIIGDLVERDPTSEHLQRELATFMSWLASTLEERGDLAGAREQFEQERQLRQAAVERDGSSADAKRLLAICLGYLGILSRDQGDADGGLRQLGQQLELLEELTGLDPTNLKWQRHLAIARFHLGETLLATGEEDAAAVHLEGGLQVMLYLVRADPLNSDWRLQRAGLGTATAAAWWAQGRLRAALREAELSHGAVEAVMAVAPDDHRTALTFARNQVLIGRIQGALGENEKAERAWRLAVENLELLVVGSNDRDLLATLATALVYLGRREDARAVAERLWAQGYQEPRFLRLWQEAPGNDLPSPNNTQ